MVEVLLATSERARNLVRQVSRGRPGEPTLPRLAMGLYCPNCAAGLVAVIDQSMTARDALGRLQQSNRCLHAGAAGGAAWGARAPAPLRTAADRSLVVG